MPLDIRAGAEYELLGKTFARTGVCTHPFQYTFGCGVGFGSVIVDFSASVHQVLGFSPQISIQYLFHNKVQIH